MKAVVSKYCKFAYSSDFAFSVPTGTAIEQIPPDSVLALSRDGAETWAVKGKWTIEPLFGRGTVDYSGNDECERIHVASFQWNPWADFSVVVDTTLIPPTDRWPDWHIRVHDISSSSQDTPVSSSLHTVEGGFAILGRAAASGRQVPTLDSLPDDADVGVAEGVVETEDSVLILSGAGASGIVTAFLVTDNEGATRCYPLKPDSNTNLACQRTLIPVVAHDFSAPPTASSQDKIRLVTMVFAISAKANGGWKKRGKTLKERWLDRPALRFGASDGPISSDVIRIGNPAA